jgi:hypothetical protein
MSHEWPAYIFDAIPMFAVTVIYYIKFPSQLQAGGSRFRGDDEALTHIAVPTK